MYFKDDTAVTMDGTEVSNSELKEYIMEMKKDIMSKLDENRREIQEVKDELKSLTSTVTDVERATESHAQRLDDIEKKTLPETQSSMDKKILDLEKKLEEKLLLAEIHDRKNNVLVYGVEEREHEDLKMVLLDVWHHNLCD